MSVPLFTHPDMLAHLTGEGHPEKPGRLKAVLDAIDDAKLGADRRLAGEASVADLERVHPSAYVARLLRASPDHGAAQLDADTLLSPGSVRAGRLAAGAAVDAVRAVARGEMTRAFAAVAADKPLEPFSFTRRDPLPDDVVIDIQYCGVCHSDLHMARSETGPARYPLVPGHEIAGVVKAVGSDVTRFKVGDRVGVGCMVDSCRECSSCQAGEEQYCVPGFTGTYGNPDRFAEQSGQPITQGGYSDHITVDQHFVLSIPDALPLDKAAPLLCAGITTYSPLARWQVKEGDKVAVVGLGGLGHMGVQIAAAKGAEVTVISRSLRKEKEAYELGAKQILATGEDEDFFDNHRGEFDVIIYATGFDAITGSFDKIDFRGAHGARLKEKWTHGPETYLGLMVDGFPNMMMLMGPHTALGNIPRSIEYSVDWVTGLLRFAQQKGLTFLDATPEGTAGWTDHVKALGVGLLSNEVDSWMTGINRNVEGKQRRIVARYSGSAPAYRARCDEVAATGYAELKLG